ncbi:unnamed protein product [Rotaria sp. Silwood2]|nr:unnamed protein product [Rotaria sp. Silwood2]CAF4219415.1 unnamed protein product [Rotaria sp. Silwood2]
MRPSTSCFTDNWRLFRMYFFSEERIYARIMLLILIILELISIGLNVLLTYWNKDLIDTFIKFDQSAFLRSLLYFIFIAIGIIIVLVYKQYLAQLLQLRWRRWLTDDFLSKYLSKHAYYQMSLLKNNCPTIDDPNDNPDQRISMDVNVYVENVYMLLIGLLNSFVSLISYVFVLWSHSGVIKINLTQNFSFEIKGVMVWSALIYAGLGTLITNLIGRVLFRLKYVQEHYEANFRYGLVGLRDHAESVAFYRSESNEKASLTSLYADIMFNFRQIIHRKLIFNSFNAFYRMLAIIFPFLVASPRYFSRKITLGDLTQIAVTFENVHRALSFIPNSYETIVQWRSATKRLIEFQYVLNELHAAKQNSKIQFVYLPNEQSMKIQELTVRLPLKIGEDNGQILINRFNLILQSHQTVLITVRLKQYLIRISFFFRLTGKSGSGKSTFLRTLAGIWSYGSGTITFPINDTVAFLPQKPYCPLGSLRNCLTYPSTSFSSEENKKIEYILNLCKMQCWFDRLDEIQDWSRILSLGEQQKMAFIRILYLKPKWLFLDEATSSLDEQAETYFYSILIQQLINYSTIISVGHRNNLRQFHRVELALDRGLITILSLSSEDKLKNTCF